jgi:hypothetical protein
MPTRQWNGLNALQHFVGILSDSPEEPDSSENKDSPENKESPGNERLGQPTASQFVVKAAPYDGRKLPALTEFRQVEVRDVSPEEIVFHWPESPRTELMMVMFGDPDCPICAPGRVVQDRERYWRDRWRYVVRCRFLDEAR